MKKTFSNPNAIPTNVLMYMAWRNLMHKKLRAFLTIFGVVIGIGAIFFLLSFGIGLQRLVTNQVIGSQSIKSIDVTTSNSKIIKLDQPNFNKMKNLPHVVQGGSSYSYAASLKAHGSEVDAIAYGDDENYLGMDNLTLSAGRLLQASDKKGILLNNTALQSVGFKDAKAAIGKQLSLRIPLGDIRLQDVNDTFTVVGVINTQGGNEVLIPGSIFAAAGVDVYTQVKVEVDAAANVSSLRKQIESLGFLTTSPIDTIDQINQVFKFFNVILAGFGGIGMIVAVLGMFNTLTISLLERTKEIGLMVTLGGRNRDMRKLFVFEAVLLSFVGAVVGILGAIVFGQTINFGMNAFSRHRGVTEHFQLFATPWWLVSGLILFMLMVGLVVVYLPARRAARINPIDALRRE
ncbi:MAG TPA: ABC transporter permease [Candidatus Saccharimonadales bacterium]|jgi:ABC-type antimicrobial peptide transport system permease subunit|nr:ABC transporter permease [Candidatus Saccharimonadales bacterium]